MKRIAWFVTVGLAVIAGPSPARAVVAVRAGYAHASVGHATVVRAGCCYGPAYARPVGTAVGVAAGVAVGTAVGNSISAPPAPTTSVAVGTVVPALPGGCTTVQVNGITYHQCSGVYYRPYYQGTTLVYQVSRP